MAKTPRSGWSTENQEYAQAAGYGSWEEWIAKLEEVGKGGRPPGRAICGARSRQNTPCSEWKGLRESGRCRRHGTGLTGTDHPQWKTGEYSKSFPTLPLKHQEAVERALTDPDLLSTRGQLAMLEARLQELIAQLSSGESMAAWKALRLVLEDVRVAKATGDEGMLNRALSQLEALAKDGLGENSVWAQIQEAMETGRRLREAEMTRLKHLRGLIDVRKSRELFGRMVGIIRTRVRDPETLRLIMADVRKSFGGDPKEIVVANAGGI